LFFTDLILWAISEISQIKNRTARTKKCAKGYLNLKTFFFGNIYGAGTQILFWGIIIVAFTIFP